MRRFWWLLLVGFLVGCSSWHPLTPQQVLTSPAPLRSPFLGVDLYASQSYDFQTVQKLGWRNLGYIKRILRAQSVGLVWNLYTPSTASVQVRRTSISLTPVSVAALTRQAQTLGLVVEYRPLIRVGPSWTWEGHINPSSQGAWFASLYRAELPYLREAQSLHVREFVVATELRMLAGSPLWPSFLARVRKVYHGIVSYAAWQREYYSPSPALPPTSQYGVDPYPHVQLPSSASIRQLVAAWSIPFRQVPGTVLQNSTMQEVSIPALDGAYRHAERWNIGGVPDQRVQARWFTAACLVVVKYHMLGIYFYEVNLADDPANPLPFAAYFVDKQGATAIRGCRQILKPSS